MRRLQNDSSSLLLRGGELLVTVRAVHNELVLARVLDDAAADELLHHVCGQRTCLVRFLEL